MSTEKLVSIIIPMYNAEHTIITAITSIKNQTYETFEIIVIDDGSIDNSYFLVRDFIEKNPTLNVHLLKKENGGVSSARNVGLKQAHGDFIAFLDSDDEWLSRKLEIQLSIFENNPKIDFLGTNRNNEFYKNLPWIKFDYLTKITPKILLFKFVFIVPTIIFKSKIVERIGLFDETQRYAEEGNYFLRIGQFFNCYLLKESLVITGNGKAHFGESGLSSNLLGMEKGELKNIKFAYNNSIINFIEYIIFTFYSILKFIRRLFIVKVFR